jgi:hypothetical protein
MKYEEKSPFGRDGRKTVVIELLMKKEKYPFVGHESTRWSGVEVELPSLASSALEESEWATLRTSRTPGTCRLGSYFGTRVGLDALRGGLYRRKNPITPSRIETATFRFLAQKIRSNICT